MGKKVPDSILDLMLTQAEGTKVHVCSAEPANYAGIAAVQLVIDDVGTYTKANGDTSGRKNTQAGTTGSPIATTGTANHVCISDGVSDLKLVTTCVAQALTSGGTVDIGAFDHEIGDPT